MNDNKVPFGKTAEEIVKEAVSKYNYPVCFGFPAGHLDVNNALIMGRTVELKVGKEQCTLNFKHGEAQ
jgi:muramoyltetrapeptide carboxypeptidase